MPLILILNILAYCSAAAVIILPFFLFGLKSVGLVILAVLVILTAAAGAIFLAYILGEGKIWNWFRKNEVIHVAGEYIKAKKQKICPYIYFKGDK
jgi:hypothetical protein